MQNMPIIKEKERKMYPKDKEEKGEHREGGGGGKKKIERKKGGSVGKVGQGVG